MTQPRRLTLVLCLGFVACNAADIVLYEQADGGADAGTAGISGSIGSSSAGLGGGGESANGGGANASGSAGLDAGGLSSGGSAGTIGEAGAINDGLVPCEKTEDCPPAWFCSKAACGDAVGSCAPRPLTCDPSLVPVCGCDHVVYWNTCLRKDYGVSADTDGECGKPINCTTDTDCPPTGVTCAHLSPSQMSGCPAANAGRCWATPNDCSASFDFRHWMPCSFAQRGPPGQCVSTCDAIQSGQTYVQAPRGVCNGN